MFLCVWHVTRAWVKNLNQKVNGKSVRKRMLKGLTAILEAPTMAEAEQAMQEFLQYWVRTQSATQRARACVCVSNCVSRAAPRRSAQRGARAIHASHIPRRTRGCP